MSEGPASSLLAFAREALEKARAERPERPESLLDDPEPPHRRAHPHALVLSHATRTATCKACGMELTAFEALVYVAREWTMYRHNLDALLSHLRELGERKARLQAEVSRLKAEKRRLDESIATKTAKLEHKREK